MGGAAAAGAAPDSVNMILIRYACLGREAKGISHPQE
jgi:hypothetical protein